MKITKRTALGVIFGFVLGTVTSYHLGVYDTLLWKHNRDNVYDLFEHLTSTSADISEDEYAERDMFLNCMADTYVNMADNYNCSYGIFEDIRENVILCSTTAAYNGQLFMDDVLLCVYKESGVTVEQERR